MNPSHDEIQPPDEELPEAVERPSWLIDMPYWAISALLHLILFCVILAIPFAVERTDTEEETSIQVRPPPPPPREYDPFRPREVVETKLTTDHPLPEPPKVITSVDVEIPTEEELDVRSLYPTETTGFNYQIGVGVGAIGGESRVKRVTGPGGGGTESAVRAALEWLRRHQDEDGKWSCADYHRHGRNRNIDFARYGEDGGFPEHDVGVTGLAMLAFTGYGQTHISGDHPEYRECLRKAANYLKSVQVRSGDPQTDGRFGHPAATSLEDLPEQWIYDHSIATMAMSELLVMSNDVVGLKRSVRAAVKLCLRARNQNFGWRYGIQPGDNDSSVTGWMVLALKTAKHARLGIPATEFDRAFRGAMNWFDRATAASGRTGYLAPGDEGSRLAKGVPDPYPYSKDLSCMTAVGVLCRIFGGESRDSAVLRDGVRILLREPPRWREQRGRSLSEINFYYWYYASYALFQYGGRAWEEWNESMKRTLLASQRKSTPEAGRIQEDGSWDPIGEWGVAGGRVYTTAMGALTLEVYYRYLRHEKGQSVARGAGG